MSPVLRTLREGAIKLQVPVEPGGKLSSRMPAFYNPRMTASRDISLLCAQAYANRQGPPVTLCDLLAATGVRGLRSLAVNGITEVHLNDIGRTAFELMQKNLKLNYRAQVEERGPRGLAFRAEGKRVSISNLEARAYLAEHKNSLHILDLDPFGTPAGLVEPCLKALRHGSMFCVTATDTATLCGTYPKACVRRYSSLPIRTEYRHEVGLRILAAFVLRRAASMEMGCTPVFSHATDHYYRICFRTTGSRRAADVALAGLGWGLHCPICGERRARPGFLPPEEECCGRRMPVLGPLWTGPLKEGSFVEEMISSNRPEFSITPAALKIVENVAGELEVYSFHDIHGIARSLGIPAPATGRVIRALDDLGYPATPTHVTGTGVKTAAPAREVASLVNELSRG
jgi:tRNA (guanine26-N2/guanine27-N2)-dimethyltransferase